MGAGRQGATGSRGGGRLCVLGGALDGVPGVAYSLRPLLTGEVVLAEDPFRELVLSDNGLRRWRSRRCRFSTGVPNKTPSGNWAGDAPRPSPGRSRRRWLASASQQTHPDMRTERGETGGGGWGGADRLRCKEDAELWWRVATIAANGGANLLEEEPLHYRVAHLLSHHLCAAAKQLQEKACGRPCVRASAAGPGKYWAMKEK